ncbi:hypothetical protein FKW77_003284 [Venturia effusa]|uniref:Uncharacterized protein n=1 Tax=Venturia effusa TaxID=50376 RepID=A0A517LJX9_9PEZI|nr:hypothetical protein FKW77_003284 [Venturia effusa]
MKRNSSSSACLNQGFRHYFDIFIHWIATLFHLCIVLCDILWNKLRRSGDQNGSGSGNDADRAKDLIPTDRAPRISLSFSENSLGILNQFPHGESSGSIVRQSGRAPQDILVHGTTGRVGGITTGESSSAAMTDGISSEPAIQQPREPSLAKLFGVSIPAESSIATENATPAERFAAAEIESRLSTADTAIDSPMVNDWPLVIDTPLANDWPLADDWPVSGADASEPQPAEMAATPHTET